MALSNWPLSLSIGAKLAIVICTGLAPLAKTCGPCRSSSIGTKCVLLVKPQTWAVIPSRAQQHGPTNSCRPTCRYPTHPWARLLMRITLMPTCMPSTCANCAKRVAWFALKAKSRKCRNAPAMAMLMPWCWPVANVLKATCSSTVRALEAC